MTAVLNTISTYAIPLVLLFIPLYAIIKGVKVYSVIAATLIVNIMWF